MASEPRTGYGHGANTNVITRVEAELGDKSPKSKQKNANQKKNSKQEKAAKAKAKRDKQGGGNK